MLRFAVLLRRSCIPLLSLLLLPVGCGEETRFFIVQNQVPKEGCVVAGDKTDVYRGEGYLDVGLVSDGAAFAYDLFPLVQNDLPGNGSGMGSPQPNRLVIKGFRVTVELDPAAPEAARQVFDRLAADETGRGFLSYEEPWSGTLEPGGSTKAAGVGVFPAEIARRLRDTGYFDGEGVRELRASVTVRALAERQAGDLETPPFRYPLRLCQGCLMAFQGTCPLRERRFAGNACNLAQDEPVDCCLDGGRMRCPAPVADKTSMTPATP
jgi:hypothetical protein